MESIECGKVIRSSELVFNISCNFCSKVYTEIEKFSLHFNDFHLDEIKKELGEAENRLEADIKEIIPSDLESYQSETFGVEELEQIIINESDIKEEVESDVSLQANQGGTSKSPIKICNEYSKDRDQLDELDDYLKKYESNNSLLPFKCPECSKLFKLKVKLKVHYKRVHLKERRFKCNFCEKAFFDNKDKISHIQRIHTKKIVETSLKSSSKCPIKKCNEYLKNQDQLHELKEHSKKYDSGNALLPFKCPLCDKLFRLKVKLKVHYKRVHLKERRFKCNFCEKAFFDNKDKVSHITRIHIKKTVKTSQKIVSKCPIDNCNEYFDNQDQLDNHSRTYHSENSLLPFKCPLCSKLFRQKTKLNVHHKRVHLKEKRFKCSLCEKAFFENKDRFVHERRIHMKEAICVCDDCGKAFISVSSLNLHKKKMHIKELNMILHEYKCQTCGKAFKRKDYLISHYKTHNANKIKGGTKSNEVELENQMSIISEVNIKEETESYAIFQKSAHNFLKCCIKSCNECFDNQEQLDNHSKTYHSGNPALPFKCPQCSKLFRLKIKLKIHQKRVHLQERRFKCSSCDKSFFDNTDRIIHERTHTKEIFGVCEVCGEGFTTAACLRLHRQRKHFKELNIPLDEYNCQICGKTFQRKEYLKSHSKTHNNEKKYICNICSMSFSWSSTLKRHMNVHNNERDFVCKLCEKDFTSKLRITCHMKSHGLPYISENVYRKSANRLYE